MSQKTFDSKEDNSIDIIQETRDIVFKMTKAERFKKAKRHLMDALNYRQARNDIDTNNSMFFHFCYKVQTSAWWNYLLFLLSMVYMYLIVAEPNNRLDLTVPRDTAVIVLDNTILLLMVLDCFFEIVHKNSWNASSNKKYPFRFKIKIVLVSLLLVDNIVFYSLFLTYPIRVFRFLRSFMPYFYDYFSRKALHSLWAAAKDIIVYLIFYTIVIMAFSIVGNQIINLPPDMTYDKYNSNYYDLGKMSFLIYVLASYDAWPDYELKAVDASKWYYPFFVAFIFLNCFYFVTIPTTVIFASFKSFRSKIVLLDDIKQRNSLLLCFVSLGEKDLTIKSSTFHEFMLYVYKQKLRLLDHIKQLSFLLDPNNNSVIYISDFMKLCNIMEEDSHMRPPVFPDWEGFIRFRKYLKQRFYIKKIVMSDIFQVIVIVVILLNFVIIMVSFFTVFNGYETIQIVLLAFYTCQFIIRFFGEGPQKFFADEKNWIDVFLLVISFSLLGDSQDVSVVLRKVARLIRLFRVNRIVRILWRNDFFRKKIYLNSIYRKLRLLFNQLWICSIVGLKMFPLFMTCFYVLSIYGMERYDNRFVSMTSTPYSLYDKYSSFRNLVEGHLICVQVMIEAGWSPIVFDYAERYNAFGQVAIFFVCMHICIVIILVSLMKGMAADLYSSIYNKYEEILKFDLEEVEKEKKELERKLEYEQIRDSVNRGQLIAQDTLKKKEIKQAKKDREMIEELKKLYEDKRMTSPLRNKKQRTLALSQQYSSKDLIYKKKYQPIFDPSAISASQIKLQQPEILSHQQLNAVTEQKVIDVMALNQSLGDSDIEDLQDDFVDKVQLREEDTPFSVFPFYPKFLKDFIATKLKSVNRLQSRHVIVDCDPLPYFDMNRQRIGQNLQSTSFYTHIIQTLLHIQKPEESRKKEILKDIIQMKIPQAAPEFIERRLSKKYKKVKPVEIESILRKVYLNDTNEDLIQKFQFEYFSDIYGNSFKEMSRTVLEPILRHEALLMDSLAKVLRYPSIKIDDFFHILATIEYKMSNSIVRNGSIFKFVFQVEDLAENWFAIEVKQNKQLKLHFLKSSIWIYDKDMQHDQIYYGHDIFWYDQSEFPGSQPAANDKIIKLLYNAFESLGFSMLNENNFFNSDPAENVYDLYSFVTPADRHIKSHHLLQISDDTVKTDLKISKIMLVILSKQNERPKNKPLGYELTNLKTILENKKKKKVNPDFKFDDAQNETYEKLKNLAAEDEEKIAQTDGLPYAFLIDMMMTVQNILKLSKNSLITKVEQVLNDQFNKAPKRESESISMDSHI